MFTDRHAPHEHAPEECGAKACPRDGIGVPRWGVHWSQWVLSRGSVLLLLLSLLAFASVSPAFAHTATAGQISEFRLPASCMSPCEPASQMVRGSDGNLWFSMTSPSGLGRITPGGRVSLFPEPNGNQSDAMIVGPNMPVGSDGNVWFLETSFNVHGIRVFRVGRITPSGQITEFGIPDFQGNPVEAHQLTAAPDGNLWFTAMSLQGKLQSHGFIGRVTTAGVITEFGTPTAISFPWAIAVGSDSNVWFTEATADAVGRITTH